MLIFCDIVPIENAIAESAARVAAAALPKVGFATRRADAPAAVSWIQTLILPKLDPSFEAIVAVVLTVNIAVSVLIDGIILTF